MTASRLRARRALIALRARAARRRAPKSIKTRDRMSAAALSRRNVDREHRGLDPIDTSVDHAGNPDHELDQMPDSLLDDR